MRSLKVLAISLFMAMIASSGWGAWNPDLPADNSKLKDTPGYLRANWDAIELGTDPALQVTNDKIAVDAGIYDTKLNTISTAGKVNATAITNLSGMPSGAGALPLVNGGTGASTRQTALNALAAISLTGTSGQALVSDGTNMGLGLPSGFTLASQTTGDLSWYNGTNWVRLAPGTTDYPLVSNGAGAAPAYEQVNLATGVQGVLPVANGGTGQTTAQGAVDALLPSQTGNSGKFLTTNGSASSWDSVTQYSPTFYVGSASFSGSSTITISGVGFQPSLILTSTITSSSKLESTGAYISGTQMCRTSGNVQNGVIYKMYDGSPSSGYISSVNSDGFVITRIAGDNIHMLFVAIK